MAGMALYQNLVADLRGEEFVEHIPQTRLLALLVLVMALVWPLAAIWPSKVNGCID